MGVEIPRACAHRGCGSHSCDRGYRRVRTAPRRLSETARACGPFPVSHAVRASAPFRPRRVPAGGIPWRVRQGLQTDARLRSALRHAHGPPGPVSRRRADAVSRRAVRRGGEIRPRPAVLGRLRP